MEPMSDASTSERMLMQRAWRMKLPINGSLELLPLCNMNCDMCYVRLSKGEQEKKGNIRTAEEWLALGKEMKEAGVMFLLLTGGEPLLHPEFKKIYLGLKAMGMILTINSNGTLIDEEWAAFFAENPPRRINITLYGASNATYQRLCHYEKGYDRTIQAVKLLKDHNIDVRLGSSVTNYNHEDLADIYRISKDLGIFTIADTYMVSAERERERAFAYESRLTPEDAAKYRVFALKETIGPEQFPDYLKNLIWQVENIVPEDEAGRVTCYAGNCSFAVSWLGEMHPCVTMTSPSANVFEMGFQNAWEHISNEVARIRTSMKCSACRYRPICKNCAGNALVETGFYDGTPDYLCRFAEESYRLFKNEAEKLHIDI